MFRCFRLSIFAAAAALSAAVFAAGNAYAEESSEKADDAGWRVPILTGVDPEKRDYYEDLGRKSDKILDDRSFIEKWRRPGALQAPKQAEEALDEADKALGLVERALKNKTAACYYKFLVNRCISEAKEKSNERQREIRGVMVDARTILHKAKSEENARRKEERLAKPLPPPVDIAPKTVKPAPREPTVKFKPKEVKPASLPGDYSRKEVKEPSEPTGWEAKTVREPSAPSGFKASTAKEPSAPSGMSVPGSGEKSKGAGVSPRTEQPTREELEQANLKALAEKEAEAAERRREAAEKAEKRKAKREERSRRFTEDQERRRAAQLEYEKERAEGKKSGLSDYF